MSNTANQWADRTWNLLAETFEYSGLGLFMANASPSEEGRPKRVLIEGDWLDLPTERLAEMLDTIRQCPNLDFMLVTERLDSFRHRVSTVKDLCFAGNAKAKYCMTIETQLMLSDWLRGTPPANIWIGTIIKDQPSADERISHLLPIPAAKRFVIVEPTGAVKLEASALSGVCYCGGVCEDECTDLRKLDWVIMRGETGRDAKPMHPDCAGAMRDQCAAAGVPFWFEWGKFAPESALPKYHPTVGYRRFEDGATVFWPQGGKQAAGGLLDGEEWRQVPGGDA
jgi:hypothetical protein